jgi:hypothetical protein
VIDMGDSWDKTQGTGGYDLKVIRITNSAIPGPKPKLYIHGSLHAREYATAELVLRFALYLIANYGKDADVTWMVDHNEFHGQVYANPDGRKYAEKGQMWRKNTNKKYCTSNTSMRGADLNRNFDNNWSSSSDQCSETYSGASAASEPETQAVQNYLKQNFPVKKQGIYIDLHAYARTIMHCTAPELDLLAARLSFFNRYSTYTKRAMTMDYGYQVVGVASFLIELGTAFFENCNNFETDLVPKHIPLFVYALRNAREPFTSPSGPDAIKISLVDKKLQATITDTLYFNTMTTHTITGAEYYINTPPWVTGATPITMKASDGNFDQKTEKVEAVISDKNLHSRKSTIFIRGKDASGFWGSVYAIYSDLTGTVPFISETGKPMVTLTCPHAMLSPVTLSFHVSKPGYIQWKIYSIDGKVISTVINRKMETGYHTVSWNRESDAGTKLAAGVYLYTLFIDDEMTSEKFVLDK